MYVGKSKNIQAYNLFNFPFMYAYFDKETFSQTCVVCVAKKKRLANKLNVGIGWIHYEDFIVH